MLEYGRYVRRKDLLHASLRLFPSFPCSTSGIFPG
jgi:hypothetical protein